jgi:hypothetical protein
VTVVAGPESAPEVGVGVAESPVDVAASVVGEVTPESTPESALACVPVSSSPSDVEVLEVHASMSSDVNPTVAAATAFLAEGCIAERRALRAPIADRP